MSLPITSIDRFQGRCGAVVLLGLGAVLLGLGGRLVYINTTLCPRLTAIAARQQHGTSAVPARRGMIFDARGRVVALSEQAPDVFVDPAFVKDIDALAAEVAARVSLPVSEIVNKVRARTDSRFVLVAQQVDAVTAAAVRDLDNPAVGLVDRAKRCYPLGDSMASVLGWVGRDGYGLEGIELALDGHLRGRDGRRATIRDSRRRVLRHSVAPSTPPVDGGHLVLTIDAEIQRLTEESLAAGIAKVKAESGVAIVMSPSDGAILAMANLPTFDPGEPPTPQSMPFRRNRAITDPVEPGSSFKPIIACGALEAGVITLGEQIDCSMGSRYFGKRLITDTTPHGLLDFRGIITVSSNIGMAIIGERMGNERLHDIVRRFGFGEPTGINCPGESSGVVYPLRRWNTYTTTSVPIGYEVLVTPLQLVNAFAAIVNDGVLLKPRLIRKLLGPDGEVLQSFESPEIVRRVVSSEVARIVARDLMVSVVEKGSGKNAKAGPYRVLGKTGTAKLLREDRRGYESGAYLAVFVGAAPVRDPQVVALVMIRKPNPKDGYYGGVVAAPVVGEILEKTLAYLEVPPDEPLTLTGL
jgi:cell division protein FtsI (penicillin-binding protein 3)